MRYNGWTNYETWLCNLWMDSSWDYYHESAKEACEDSVDENGVDREKAIKVFAAWLRDEYCNCTSDLGLTAFLCDLLQSAIDSIDFHEIASHWVENASRELANEDSESC